MQGFSRPELVRRNLEATTTSKKNKPRPTLKQMVPSYRTCDHEAKFKEETGPYYPYFKEACRLLEENPVKVDLSMLYDCQRVLALIIALLNFKLFKSMGGGRTGQWVTIGMDRMRNELGMRSDRLRADDQKKARSCFSELQRVGVIQHCKVEPVSGVIPPKFGSISQVEFEQLKYDSSQLTVESGSDFWTKRCFQPRATFFRLGESVQLNYDLPEFKPFESGFNNQSHTSNISQTELNHTKRDMNHSSGEKSDQSQTSVGQTNYDSRLRLKEESLKEEESRDSFSIRTNLTPVQADAYDLLTGFTAGFPGYEGGKIWSEVAYNLVLSDLSGNIEEIKLQIDFLKEEWRQGVRRQNMAGLLVQRIKKRFRPVNSNNNVPSRSIRSYPAATAYLADRDKPDLEPEPELGQEEYSPPVAIEVTQSPALLDDRQLEAAWADIKEDLGGRLRFSPEKLSYLEGSIMVNSETEAGVLVVRLKSIWQERLLGQEDRSKIALSIRQCLGIPGYLVEFTA